MAILLETPVFSPSSARRAVSGGAGRVELNRRGSYPDGGLTPDMADLEAVARLPAPVSVMIRPRGPPPGGRGRDFVYAEGELAQMRASIRAAKMAGRMSFERGDRFVLGALREEDVGGAGPGGPPAAAVDAERCAELVRLARPFGCVFHRAFDDAVGRGGEAAAAALECVVACGFDAVLTSGGPGAAADNAAALERIARRAAGRIEVIVGGGVRSHNVGALAAALGGHDRVSFHSSCLTPSSGEEVDDDEVTKMVEGLAAVERAAS